MKRVVLICALLAIKSVQGGNFDDLVKYGASSISQQHFQTNLMNIHQNNIIGAIKKGDVLECNQALNNRKKEITDNINFYDKKCTTLSSGEKLATIAAIISQTTFEKENYKRLVELTKNGLPNINKIEKEVSEQKSASFWKGLFGLGMVFGASSCGWLAKNSECIKLGSLSLPTGNATFYGLLTLGGLFGLSGIKNVCGAVDQHVSACTYFKNSKTRNKKALKILAEIENNINKINLLQGCDREILKKAEEFAREQGNLNNSLLESINYYYKSGAQLHLLKQSFPTSELMNAKINFYKNTNELRLAELYKKRELIDKELESLQASINCNKKAAIWYGSNASDMIEDEDPNSKEEEEEETLINHIEHINPTNSDVVSEAESSVSDETEEVFVAETGSNQNGYSSPPTSYIGLYSEEPQQNGIN